MDHQQEPGYDFWCCATPWGNEICVLRFCVLPPEFPELLARRRPWPTSPPLICAETPVNGDRLIWLVECTFPGGGVAAPNRSRGHGWSARSNARTNDLGAGEERRMLGR